MKSPKSLIWFILLNILVSVGSASAVIYLWGCYQNTLCGTTPQQVAQAVSNLVYKTEVAGEATLPPLDRTVIEISNVFGTGDLKNESVQFSQRGNTELWLTGWKLTDENDNSFIFPALKLNQGATVTLYTRAGINNVRSLYWGLAVPVFKLGEKITLEDSAGNVRAEYIIK